MDCPISGQFSNYTDALFNRHILKFFINSVVVTGATLMLTIVVSVMLAYALTRMRWKLFYKGKQSSNTWDTSSITNRDCSYFYDVTKYASD